VAGELLLIVDDNATNLKLVRVVLEGAGYQVRVALDADAALGILREFRPQLILMDIQLPGMDGLSLTRMLKANPSMRDIIILGLTAYAMKGDEERILAAGCDGYIAKPLNTRTLPGIVASHLDGAARGGAV
jgi:CheY-like chemotaxis protein